MRSSLGLKTLIHWLATYCYYLTSIYSSKTKQWHGMYRCVPATWQQDPSYQVVIKIV